MCSIFRSYPLPYNRTKLDIFLGYGLHSAAAAAQQLTLAYRLDRNLQNCSC